MMMQEAENLCGEVRGFTGMNLQTDVSFQFYWEVNKGVSCWTVCTFYIGKAWWQLRQIVNFIKSFLDVSPWFTSKAYLPSKWFQVLRLSSVLCPEWTQTDVNPLGATKQLYNKWFHNHIDHIFDKSSFLMSAERSQGFSLLRNAHHSIPDAKGSSYYSLYLKFTPKI